MLVQRLSSECGQVFFQYLTNEDLAHELKTRVGAIPVHGDLRDSETIQRLTELDVDILVNNAGVNISDARVAQVSDEDWAKTLEVNLVAPFRLCRGVLDGMSDRQWGRIINISSIYGLVSSENNLPYNVAKHGLSALTKTIAREYARYGITANEVCPGPIESHLMDRIAASKASPGENPREWLDQLASHIPTRRLATPTDVASLVAYLASEAAAHINGDSIRVDGGQLA